MSLQDMMRDTVIFVDAEGNESEAFDCSFSSDRVTILAESLDVEEGAKAFRVLPNGKRESYTILEVNYRREFHSIPASYRLTVRKDASLISSAERNTNINISHSHGIQIGDHNIQTIVASFSHLITQIESSTVPEAEKQEAKNKLLQVLANPLVSSILGGASGTLIELLAK